jgi:eukaryotic-like serine/threonine-protein kinase
VKDHAGAGGLPSQLMQVGAPAASGAPPRPAAGASPQLASDAVAEPFSDATPERASDATPERASDATPERASDAAPERASDAAPEPAAGAPPRRLGLLDARQPRAERRPPKQHYLYPVGHRIAGDLTVTGHLAAGRACHLYQVWSARDWCAFTCKIVAPERSASRAALGALRREARILRALGHPNIVRYFGKGEHEGVPFLLLEYLEGASMFDVLETQPRRRLEITDAVRAAIHLGAALYHMHRRGFVHLDLKPSNLLLRDGLPVLIDLDTARRADPGRRPSHRIGTTPYMAPEQARRDPLGPASDVYGLGTLLYELLTGRWVYEDIYAEPLADGRPRQFPQADDEPVPPPRSFRPSISESLERTVLTCLAHNPVDRFPSMHPLLLALVSELPEPVSLWPDGVAAERRRYPRD